MNKLKSDKLLVNQKLVTSASSAKKAGQDDTVTIDKTETKNIHNRGWRYINKDRK